MMRHSKQGDNLHPIARPRLRVRQAGSVASVGFTNMYALRDNPQQLKIACSAGIPE